MDSRNSRKVSWLKRAQVGGDITGEDAAEAFEDPAGEGAQLTDPLDFGGRIGELALVNKILNGPEFSQFVNNLEATNANAAIRAKDSFEELAEQQRSDIVNDEIGEALGRVPDVVPALFRETQFTKLFGDLMPFYDNEQLNIAAGSAATRINDAGAFARISSEFKKLFQQLQTELLTSYAPQGGAPLASSWKRTVIAQPMPLGAPMMDQQDVPLPTPLEAEKYRGLEDLTDDLIELGPYRKTYEKILSQVDDEDQDSAKGALTAFFQGFPEGICTLYSILVQAGVAEPLDQNIVERIMEQHPQLENDDSKSNTKYEGLYLPPQDSGLYSTSSNDSCGKMEKSASGYVGGPSPSHYTHGPGEQKYCPKLRNSVNTSICRYHCLDGLPVDDHQILCGEAIWRQAVMDKFSREYKDADGNWVGGYLNKRFEIERSTHEHPYQLKPGQRHAPINEDAWSPEKRLQEMRRSEGSKREYSNTPGDPKGLYNWDSYEFHGGPKNPQIFEKKKDKIAKNAASWTKQVKIAMSINSENYSDAAQGLYWFAVNYHEGQFSELYSISSSLGYKPGPMESEPDEMGQYFYDALANGEIEPKQLYNDIQRTYDETHEDYEGYEGEEEVEENMIPMASSSWLAKNADTVGMTCKDCGADNELNSRQCINCGGMNLAPKDKMDFQNQSGVIQQEKPMGPTASRDYKDNIRKACDVYCITVKGHNYYGDTIAEAQNKVPGLGDLKPDSVQEESLEISNEMDSQDGPDSWVPREKTQPEGGLVQRPKTLEPMDPTPTTPEKPMGVVPEGSKQMDPDLKKDKARPVISGDELDAHLASDMLQTDEGVAKERNEEAARLGI